MSNFTFIPMIPLLSGAVYDPPAAVRGKAESGGLMAYSNQTLPSDPVGSMQLTLTNVVIGSAYDIEITATGDLVTSSTATASTIVLSIPVYQSGDVKNTISIKVRKGSSSPYYQPYETRAVAAIGSQSIFINQLSDE